MYRPKQVIKLLNPSGDIMVRVKASDLKKTGCAGSPLSIPNAIISIQVSEQLDVVLTAVQKEWHHTDMLAVCGLKFLGVGRLKY